MAETNNSFVRSDIPKEQKKPSFEERKKDIVQIPSSTSVTKKENAVWKWVRTMFFSGRKLSDILVEVAEKQIVPQIQDSVRNSLVSIIDLGIYKDSRGSSTSNPVPSSFVTNYVQFSNPSSNTAAKLEETKKKETELIQAGYSLPAFDTKKKADDFIASMHAYVSKYATLSVLELTWMAGKRIDFTWDKYGWEKNEVLAVKEPTHINNPNCPWMVSLPKAHLIE